MLCRFARSMEISNKRLFSFATSSPRLPLSRARRWRWGQDVSRTGQESPRQDERGAHVGRKRATPHKSPWNDSRLICTEAEFKDHFHVLPGIKEIRGRNDVVQSAAVAHAALKPTGSMFATIDLSGYLSFSQQSREVPSPLER